MFATLDKVAQADPRYTDIMLLENYAAFQNRYHFTYFMRYLDPITINFLLSQFMILQKL